MATQSEDFKKKMKTPAKADPAFPEYFVKIQGRMVTLMN